MGPSILFFNECLIVSRVNVVSFNLTLCMVTERHSPTRKYFLAFIQFGQMLHNLREFTYIPIRKSIKVLKKQLNIHQTPLFYWTRIKLSLVRYKMRKIIIKIEENNYKNMYKSLKSCKNVDFGLVWFGLVLWHINHCSLFNAKSISIHMNRSISNNSVQHKYSV